MTRTARSRRLARVLVGVALVAGLAACSGSGSSDASMAGGADAGGAVADEAAQDVAGADSGSYASTAQDDDARQVVQTGDLTLEVSDPEAAVDSVVALVEGAGGRVDSRQEQAAAGDQTGSALLTVRVPADDVTSTIDALRGLGTVSYVSLNSQDVTAVAQDLAARISAQEISVARMEDVLSRATTTSDVVAAENALTERQANLESMRAQAARIAEEVALSTLTISIVEPGLTSDTSPASFLEGLQAGWHSLGVAARAVLVMVGVLLPWLALPALVAVVVLMRRRRRGPRSPGAEPSGA